MSAHHSKSSKSSKDKSSKDDSAKGKSHKSETAKAEAAKPEAVDVKAAKADAPKVKAAKADAAPAATGAQPVEAVEATPGSTDAGDDATQADADEAPLNRAERRAKGKSTAKPSVVGKIVPGKSNLNHGPRSYANRRSG